MIQLARIVIVLYSANLFVSCNEKSGEPKTPYDITAYSISADSVWSNDYQFYADSVLKISQELIQFLIVKYDNDTCFPQKFEKKNLKEAFEGFRNIGDINNDKEEDSVFVLPPLNWCEDDLGKSFYFTDTTIPRIPSGTYSCTPSFFFVIPDIDEDGINEVGFYFTSGTSRYKSIKLYKLVKGQWDSIASRVFDMLTADPKEVKFEDLVVKLSKNKFCIKNFMDGQTYWDTINLKQQTFTTN